MKLIHIAPHVGGGVGSVIKGFLDASSKLGCSNEVYCLDHCESNFESLQPVERKEDGIFLKPQRSVLIESLTACDAVILHYWNHPLLAVFLVEVNLPPCRLIVYCHNSGLFEPHIIPRYIVRLCDRVVFSSGCSLEAPNLKELISREPEKFEVIHSTSPLEEFVRIGRNKTIPSMVTNALYLGTVSDIKLHPQAASIFAELSRKRLNIKLVGGPNHSEFKRDIDSLGGAVEITGEINNVEELFKWAHLFLYPLREDHYGTGEQVILEAMASSLPVVTFSNPAEKEILHDPRVLADSSEDFIKKTIAIRDSRELYEDISVSNHLTAIERYDYRKSTLKLLKCLERVVSSEKQPRTAVIDHRSIDPVVAALVTNTLFAGEELIEQFRDSPQGLAKKYLMSVAKKIHGEVGFSNWRGEEKGVPHHYLKYFRSSSDLLDLLESSMF